MSSKTICKGPAKAGLFVCGHADVGDSCAKLGGFARLEGCGDVGAAWRNDILAIIDQVG